MEIYSIVPDWHVSCLYPNDMRKNWAIILDDSAGAVATIVRLVTCGNTAWFFVNVCVPVAETSVKAWMSKNQIPNKKLILNWFGNMDKVALSSLGLMRLEEKRGSRKIAGISNFATGSEMAIRGGAKI